jgi:hypothetical protein
MSTLPAESREKATGKSSPGDLLQGAGQESVLPVCNSAEEGRICLEEGIEVTHGHCPLPQTRDQRWLVGEGGMGPNPQQHQALHFAALGLQSHPF